MNTSSDSPAPILMATDGAYLSHVTRTLQVGRVLREMGWTVVFAASGQWVELIDSSDFPRVPLYAAPVDVPLEATRGGNFSFYDSEMISDLVQADLTALSEVKPCLVVGDFRWSLGIAAELEGIRYVSLVNTPATEFYDESRSVPDIMTFQKLIPDPVLKRIEPPLRRVLLRYWGRPWNKARRQLGARTRKNLLSQMRGDLTLLMDSKLVFPTSPLPADHKVTGPVLFEGEATDPIELPTDLPVVYASLGSTASDELTRALFAGLAGQSVQVVMTTGGQELPGEAPSNFLVRDFINPAELLKDSAVLTICHGGNGTVYQSLSHGVPVLSITTHFDQQWVGDAVARLGAGWRLSDKTATPGQIAECVTRVLNEPDWRRNAEAVEMELAAGDGAALAATYIDDFARNGRQETMN